MSSKAKTPTKILADVYLNVYVGERGVFVKVASPDKIELEPQDKQEMIRRFYRWAAANYGLDPEMTWKSWLQWAKLPLRSFGRLSSDFSINIVSEAAFYKDQV